MLTIPSVLAASCAKSAELRAWLERLPRTVEELAQRWSLEVGEPFEVEASCSWVAPVIRSDRSRVVLKVAMPHMESEHEIAGLKLLDGDPTVRLIEADEELNAMLLEQCEPGAPLRDTFQPDQDVIIAGLLKRFWRVPPEPNPFRPLSLMIEHWHEETLNDEANWFDAGLVREGLALFDELSSTSFAETLLATDLHASNVLRSHREPWLVIDPKPFLGDPAYDTTQHLLNCRERLRSDARDTIRRFADLCEVDYDRVRFWTFARLAAEPRDQWDDEPTELARIISR